MKLPILDRNKAYISNNLILPKSGLNLSPVKAALTFQYGEEEVFDGDTGDLLGLRPANLYLWDETKHHIIAPREFIDPTGYKEFQFKFVNLRPRFPRADIRALSDVRDEGQAAALAALKDNYSGTLNLACGKGKTVLALLLAAKLKVPTLVVVNTTALLEQWKEEIETHLDVESVGIVQGKNIDWRGHPIVLAMVHTLALNRERWPMEFRRRFGLVFYDEGHHMSAPVFVRSADLFFGRRYSLTATATRTDGLQTIYQYHLGRVFYSDLTQDLIPTTIFYRLKWEFEERYKYCIVDVNGNVNSSKVRTYLGELEWRNELIFDHAIKDLRNGRELFILTHSKKHAYLLEGKFRQFGIKAGAITGNTKQGSRMPMLRASNPVIGTFQLARESLNKPTLDTLYITTPFSADNDLQQSWGRIQRTLEGKSNAIVRVYEDLALPQCERPCRTLRKHLKHRGYPYKLKRISAEEYWNP
jgi:superfamily II DNA or RNA helicase